MIQQIQNRKIVPQNNKLINPPISLLVYLLNMLYKSLQQTILEYEQRKKQTQSDGDRKLFKWKVFALSFAILLIILIGIISQLVQNNVEDEGQVLNLTFLTSILQHSNQLTLIASIKNMIYGLSQTRRVVFDKAQPILISDTFKTTQLIGRITNKHNIMFLFNLKQVNQKAQEQHYRFGMLLKRNYNNIDPDGNNDVEIYDQIDDMSSVYFSLDHKNALQMNLKSGCTLYNFSRSTGDFSIMETLEFENKKGQQENKEVDFRLLNWECFGESEESSLVQIKRLTGVELVGVNDVKNLQIESIEVFHLTFNGGTI